MPSRISDPAPRLSSNDKRLLLLLEKLLLDDIRASSSNIDEPAIGLTDGEALELSRRISDLLESKAFWQKAYLIEALSRGDANAAREPYLAGRSARGASRIMSSTHFLNFLRRLGLPSPGAPSVHPMEFEHFIRMETKLFSELGLHPSVIDLLERFIRSHEAEINASRQGGNPLGTGTLVSQLKRLAPSFDGRGEPTTTTYDRDRVVGALTLIANSSVMFGTRDWNVAGTISAMAGAVGLTLA